MNSRLYLAGFGICLVTAVAVPVLALAITSDSYNPLDLFGDGDDPLAEITVETCSALAEAGPPDAGSVLEAAYVQADEDGFTAVELRDALRSECQQSTALVGLIQTADETCIDLEGAIVLQTGGILNSSISRAEALGFEAPDLGDVMRRACPDVMTALEQVTEDQEQRELEREQRELEQERREQLPNLISLSVECAPEGAYGGVRNDSDVTVDVFIDVQFLDANGVIVADGGDSVSGLRPGETGYWDSRFFERTTRGSYHDCRAEVSNAFEN